MITSYSEALGQMMVSQAEILASCRGPDAWLGTSFMVKSTGESGFCMLLKMDTPDLIGSFIKAFEDPECG